MSPVDIVIVGGGISGLSALHFVRTLHPHFSVRLLEAETVLGGTIQTDMVDGYNFDRGPNGFLDREPLTLRLCNELDLNEKLERAGESASNRYILRQGRLRKVPMSPQSFLFSDILKLKGKLRLLAEPFASGPPHDLDESVYDFAVRRIGKEAADYLVQPMVSGIYGGLAERLSLRSCFSVMADMEREHGSLLKAMIAKARKAKREGRKTGGPAGPAGWLTSFENGLSCLTDRLRDRHSAHISTNSPVCIVEKQSGQFRIEIQNGANLSAHSVILATPSYEAARITRKLSQTLASALEQIVYAPIAVACMGYDDLSIGRRLDGFGFLIPRREQRQILGSIWTSSIFANRAPKGKVQLRMMIGGDGDHDSIQLSDDALTLLVRKELDDILDISDPPEIVRVYRFPRGIPQYHIGHSSILSNIEEGLARVGNLYLSGNAYYGIGLNDCVRQSYSVVNSLDSIWSPARRPLAGC
ncbi:MAG: protoporphyrinogen oxidase [Candidatus Zixiibacteriota bacterium]